MKQVRFTAPTLVGALALFAAVAQATTINENFSTDPLQHGWQIFGDTNLFTWNATNQKLEVTWDSSQTNSYFYQPLGTTITRYDDFSLAFDLTLHDIASGTEAGKTGPMEIGFGFLNFAGATNATFMRGAYGSAPNVAEFGYYAHGYYDYFGTIYDSPAAAVPSFISGVNSFDYAPQILSVYDCELPTNQTLHVTFVYTATNQTAALTITTNGAMVAAFPDLALDGSNGFADPTNDDFLVDTFSISSYSSFGDDYDSILAHGTVANIQVTVPPPARNLVGSFTNDLWRVDFSARTNWLFTLQRTTDFQSWTNVSPAIAGSNGNLFLQDTNPVGGQAFYRIQAERP